MFIQDVIHGNKPEIAEPVVSFNIRKIMEN